MKMSTRARYALRLMIDLAENSGGDDDARFVKLKDVAARQQISKDYLVHLVTALKTASLVRSSCGRNGGYALTLPPARIKALEIVEAAIGPINILECLSDESFCHRAGDCRSRWVWGAVNDKIREALGDITLEGIADGHRDSKGRPLEDGVLGGLDKPGACERKPQPDGV